MPFRATIAPTSATLTNARTDFHPSEDEEDAAEDDVFFVAAFLLGVAGVAGAGDDLPDPGVLFLALVDIFRRCVDDVVHEAPSCKETGIRTFFLAKL